MELSEAKKELEQLSASIGPVDSEYLKEHEPENYKLNQAIDTVLKALDNSISKDKVRKLYEEHKKILRYYDNCNLEQDDTYHEHIKVCDVLLELLGE